MKTCPKCKTPKQFSDFYRSKAKADGLQSWCKQCFQQHKRKARELDGEHIRQLSNADYKRRSANPEWVTRVRERQRQWYLKNREKVISWSTNFRNDGKEKPESKAKRWKRNAADSRKRRELLADSYVAQLICRRSEVLKPNQIPTELLASKKEQIFLRRLARQLKKALNETITNTN